MGVLVFVVLVSLVAAGCTKKPHQPEETLTKGKLLVLVTESHEKLMKQET